MVLNYTIVGLFFFFLLLKYSGVCVIDDPEVIALVRGRLRSLT